ncbi:MAG TPA: glycosyltransferase, partial [Steroidobacteraceae bacterium]
MSIEVKRGRVSAVVASYNHARFLQQRMDSLIAQTYPDLEIIVIDDCSPDNSVEILRHYEHHPRVKLIVRERNGGWVAVSNQGIELATGEFVIFANCDDACDPRMIERLVTGLQVNPTAGIAFCRSKLVDANNHVLGDDREYQNAKFRTLCATDVLIPGAQMGQLLLYGCVISNLSAALFRRTCFEAAGNLSCDYRACSDWDLFFRVAKRFDTAYIAAPLNLFRQHATTIRSRMKERETYQEYFRVLLSHGASLHLSALERARFRTHIMFLWAVHLMSPSLQGLADLPYHLRLLLRLDPLAVMFLPAGIALRIGNLA